MRRVSSRDILNCDCDFVVDVRIEAIAMAKADDGEFGVETGRG
jgi:hypothetical protein